MHSIVFIFAGLLFLAVAWLGRKTFDQFRANSYKVAGQIVEITKSTQRLDDSTTTFNLPVVEYALDDGRRFRFTGEIDVDQNKLKLGMPVVVLVSQRNPAIAKLDRASKEKVLVLRIFAGLGLAGCAVGAYLFDPADYQLRYLKDPFVLGASAIGLFWLYTRGIPLINTLRAPGAMQYSVNAEEVSEQP